MKDGYMKHLFTPCLIFTIFAASTSPIMAAEVVAWEGKYHAAWPGGAPGTDGEFSIVKATEPDRWLLTSPKDTRSIELRAFLPGEYAGLNTSGAVQCLNGGNIAICRGKSGTAVSFDGGGPLPENYVIRTGYFGIFIQNGAIAFELTKLSKTP